MTESLRALLAGAIDYAGLFPPAGLPLDEAVRNYARYRTGPEAWMLGRFVIPAARLAELGPHDDLFAARPPFTFSVLGRGGDTPEAWQAGLQADLAAVEQFRARHGPHAVADAFEVKVPPVRGALRTATESLAAAGLGVVYEVPLGADWEHTLPTTLAGMAGSGAGVKLRTGGLEASAFPSTRQVAYVLAACREAGLPLKCTAGLHHPVRRFDPGVGTQMHGFLNVFVAAVLAHARGLGRDRLDAVLNETDASRFVFDDAGLGWGGDRAGVEEIGAARRAAVLSFGSCRFDEPRDDLRALGLL
jgi:hypothetical protein